MGKVKYKCVLCGAEHQEFRFACRNNCDSLLRTEYAAVEFKPGNEKSVFKFLDWLPCSNKVETTIGPVVYKSENLGPKLGLKNLYIAFNGYWPEKGAGNMTGSFKDYEAMPTLEVFRENAKDKIILASAGNTARAFAYAATMLDFDTYIVIPEKMSRRLWIPLKKAQSRVHLIAVKDSCDYYAAIELAAKISRECSIDPEGGAKNTARRDGMGTVMLEAARVMERVPDHYFQAVGSGTGGISAYEASLRLSEAEGFQSNGLPCLNLSQNAPFTPIYDAWKYQTKIEPEKDVAAKVVKINSMYADILANRNPAYSMGGGLGEILQKNGGRVYEVSNREAEAASSEFEELEGVDIEPAAAVCYGSLKRALKEGLVGPEETILLNITGGGIKKLKRDYECCRVEPEFVVKCGEEQDWRKLLF